ncbi:hypothetical protein AWENTII_009333 [Aspergillus wentii]
MTVSSLSTHLSQPCGQKRSHQHHLSLTPPVLSMSSSATLICLPQTPSFHRPFVATLQSKANQISDIVYQMDSMSLSPSRKRRDTIASQQGARQGIRVIWLVIGSLHNNGSLHKELGFSFG